MRFSAVVFFAAMFGLVACTSSDEAATTVQVTSTDTSCEVGSGSAPEGAITFEVTNAGSDVTEFYLYAADGTRIVGEVEDIGPGLTRSLDVEPPPGSYLTACKPGMTGDGIRADFTVTSG